MKSALFTFVFESFREFQAVNELFLKQLLDDLKKKSKGAISVNAL